MWKANVVGVERALTFELKEGVSFPEVGPFASSEQIFDDFLLECGKYADDLPGHLAHYLL